MALAEDLERAVRVAEVRGRVTGVLASELLDGTRVYLCAFESGDWLALGDDEQPVTSRERVHAAASLAALCEAVEEFAGIEPPLPRLATHAHLDSLGTRIGRELAAAVENAFPAVEALAEQVVARHLTPLA